MFLIQYQTRFYTKMTYFCLVFLSFCDIILCQIFFDVYLFANTFVSPATELFEKRGLTEHAQTDCASTYIDKSSVKYLLTFVSTDIAKDSTLLLKPIYKRMNE